MRAHRGERRVRAEAHCNAVSERYFNQQGPGYEMIQDVMKASKRVSRIADSCSKSQRLYLKNPRRFREKLIRRLRAREERKG